MNLGQLVVSIRRYLGESRRPGTWTDADIIAWINESCTEHAQRALSVRKTVYVSSLYGVQEYVLPPDFGELLAVRFQYEGHQGTRALIYVRKQTVQDWGYSGNNLGNPDCYYIYQDSQVGDVLGLFPVPNKKRVFEYKFDEDNGYCETFQPMLTDRDARYPEVPTEFTNRVRFQIEGDQEDVQNISATDLDPCIVWVGQVDLYLRRRGHPYPGNIWLQYVNTEDESDVHISKRIPADFVDTRPNWVPFDFTDNALEFTDNLKNYEMKLRGDSDYLFPLGITLEDPEYVLSSFGGEGVLVGTGEEVSEANNYGNLAYFRMNRLRNDIEVEYYRNYCDPVEEDTDVLEIPQRYHHTIRKMTLERAYLKGGFDLALAERWGREAAAEIVLARTQAVTPTIGDRSEIRGKINRVPDASYDPKTRSGTIHWR